MPALTSAQPYPGLRPFEEGDEGYFFGREAQIRGLRQKLETSRLVAVVGRSGCGKSSLVKAGLIPLLAKKADGSSSSLWQIADFRPQGQPIEELADALLKLTPGITESNRELRRGRLAAMLHRSSRGLIEAAQELALPEQGRLLIIVDQFEEIFRFQDAKGSDADDAIAFVRLLIDAIGAETPNIHVILTMRLDFLGDCARFNRLPEAISAGQFLVPNLSRAERRAAIEEPAKKGGKTILPAVTQRLLNEIGDDPDDLPVLQHLLMRMWLQTGDHSDVTLDDYRETGGVKEAISRHADEIFNKLPTENHRRAAERLFKALSERDFRGRYIRRATRLQEVEAIVAGDLTEADRPKAAAILKDVIEAFRATDCCFLMPPAGDELEPTTLVDISHESLLRRWVKMVGTPGQEGWIAEEDRDGRNYRNLLEAAEGGFDLSSKMALQQQQWWKRNRPNDAWASRYRDSFLLVEQFVRNSGRRARIKQVAVVACIVLAVVAVIGGSLYGSYSLAERRTELEQQKKLEDDYQRLASEAREVRTKYDQAQTKIAAQEEELRKNREGFDEVLKQAARAVSPADSKTRRDIADLQRANAADSGDQRAVIDPKNASGQTLAANSIGYMWLGSDRRGNLLNSDGVSQLPPAIVKDRQYTVSVDMYLRNAPPDANYVQQPELGIMPEDTIVQIVNVLPPRTRSSGAQYWAQVRVVKLALSTIYFQFAGGGRLQAQQISKALQDRGYKIPGEELTAAAAGKREVRYFFAGQRTIATKLATDTDQVLRALKYSLPPLTVESVGSTTKSNPDGKLELWLEIPAR